MSAETEPQPKRSRWRRVLFILATVLVLLAAGVAIALYRAPLVTLPDDPPSALLIRNVRVVDVVAGVATAGQDVRVEGDRISAIAPHDPAVQPGAAQVIDGAGLTLVPGLIDVHCHLEALATAPWDLSLPDVDLALERLLFSGVTRVFDPGAAFPGVFDLRDEIARGARLGPTVHSAGPLFTTPGGHPVPMFTRMMPGFIADTLIEGSVRQVKTADEIAAAMDPVAARKPTAIKVVIDELPTGAPTFDGGQAKAVVDAAKARGLRAVAHIGSTADAIAAGRAGAAAWVHGVYKEPIPEPEIATLVGFGIPMMPTLVVFWSYGRMGRGDYPSTALEKAVASADLLANRQTKPEDHEVDAVSAAYIEHVRANESAAADNVRRLAQAGMTMLAGSDCQAGVIHGPALHRELALLVGAGLSPADALRAATVNNARFLSATTDPPYGVVAAGKRADLVLVGGDPLADVGALADIRAVILGGVPLERHAISE